MNKSIYTLVLSLICLSSIHASKEAGQLVTSIPTEESQIQSTTLVMNADASIKEEVSVKTAAHEKKAKKSKSGTLRAFFTGLVIGIAAYVGCIFIM